MRTKSKSKNNGVDPTARVEQFGADSVRRFMMFKSPPEDTLDWSDEGVQGAQRFLKRLWKAVHEHVTKGGDAEAVPPRIEHATLTSAQREMRHLAHQMLVKATDDIGRRRTFNTAIAAVMELMNALARFDDQTAAGRAVRQEALELIVLTLAPIVPHVCHELWQALGHRDVLIDAHWPEPDPAALSQDVLEIVVQVNGKLRGRIHVPASADEAAITQAALSDSNVQRFVLDKPVRRVIVKGKLVNVVV